MILGWVFGIGIVGVVSKVGLKNKGVNTCSPAGRFVLDPNPSLVDLFTTKFLVVFVV